MKTKTVKDLKEWLKNIPDDLELHFGIYDKAGFLVDETCCGDTDYVLDEPITDFAKCFYLKFTIRGEVNKLIIQKNNDNNNRN